MSQNNLHGTRRAIREIKAAGGQIRMSDALKAGLSRRMLYSLRDKGLIEQISRGFYRISSLPSLSSPDLIAVALRAPQSVICLISALSFHGITTQIPHAVHIAIRKGATIPRIHFPPIQIHQLKEPFFSEGVEVHTIDGAKVRIYDIEKTLIDCFKFRNQLGMDIVLEALKFYRTRKPFRANSLMKYARLCRVEKIVTPYLEATL